MIWSFVYNNHLCLKNIDSSFILKKTCRIYLVGVAYSTEMAYIGSFKRNSKCAGSRVVCIADVPDGGIVNYGRNITNGKVQCHHLPKSQKLSMHLHRPVLRCLNISSIIYFLINKIGMYASKCIFVHQNIQLMNYILS